MLGSPSFGGLGKLDLDPTQQPHRLTSTKDAPTDAKAVLKALLPDGVPALEPDDELLRRCANAGLPEFVAAIRKHIVPLVTGHALDVMFERPEAPAGPVSCAGR